MIIMVDTYLGLYCQVQTQPVIVSLKEKIMIGEQEEKYHQENLFSIIFRSTTSWPHQNNGPIQTPRMLKSLN